MGDNFIRPLWPSQRASAHGILPAVSFAYEAPSAPVHQAMRTLEWLGLVSKVCSIDCPECGVSMGCFENPDDVPDTVDCPSCGISFDAQEMSAEVVYLLTGWAES